MTQGRSNVRQWVTSYAISYSLDGVTWLTVQDSNKVTVVRIVNRCIIYIPCITTIFYVLMNVPIT